MEKVPRVLGMLASGEMLAAPNVVSYLTPRHGGFGVRDLLHFSFPLAIYAYPLGDLRLGNGAGRTGASPAEGGRIADLPTHSRTRRRPRAADAPGAPSMGRAA